MSTNVDEVLTSVYSEFSDAALDSSQEHFEDMLKRAVKQLRTADEHLAAIRHERDRRLSAAPQEQSK